MELCEYEGPIITHQATMSPPTSSHSTIASAPQAEEPLLEAAIAAGPERRAVVERARQHWVSRLIDLSRRNRLLYFQPLRVRTVELDAGQLARALPLLTGQPVPVGRIFRQSELVHRDEDAELFTELHEMGFEVERSTDPEGIALIPRSDVPRPDEKTAQRTAPRIMSLVQSLRGTRQQVELLAKSKGFETNYTDYMPR